MDTANYFQFGAALVFVLALIGAIALLLRTVGGLQFTQRRQTERRLQISESLLVDARRRLLLVRRDDAEYLVLLSPQGDLVLDRRLKARGTTEEALASSTFVTIKTEPRL
jgi:flagellar protein FliO/FliZ